MWSSQSPPGFEPQPVSWPLPLRRALAERFPAHIEGGRFAPLVYGSRSDARPQYALTDAWDPSKAGACTRRGGRPLRWEADAVDALAWLGRTAYSPTSCPPPGTS
jgi:hypothetical protein